MKPEERDAAYLWDMLQAARDDGVIDHERLYRTGAESIPRLISALERILDMRR